MSLAQTFAVMQSVRVNNPELADHGLAGSIRSDERADPDQPGRQLVDVMVDDPAEEPDGQRLVTFTVTDLAAL